MTIIEAITEVDSLVPGSPRVTRDGGCQDLTVL